MRSHLEVPSSYAKMSGATGTEAELKAVRARYQAMARQVPLEGGGDTIDHSATVFLMGRRGEFLTTIDGHEPDRTASAKIRMPLAANPNVDQESGWGY